MKTFAFLAAAALLAAVPAWAGDIEVSGAFVRASPAMANAGAGFVTIKNTGAAPDRLLGAEAGVSKAVELHTHIKDGDVYRMRAVDSIPVPAHGSAELKPGGDHIMFIGLTAPLVAGGTVPVKLKFEKAGTVAVDMPIMGVGAVSPGDMPMQHGGMQHR
ncbi:MAG: copper chaperone PCu(A)C [Actinomycetota bacterium]